MAKCFICEKLDKLTKHHSLPACDNLKREWPIINLCSDCHVYIHLRWSNKELRNISVSDLKILVLKFKHIKNNDL